MAKNFTENYRYERKYAVTGLSFDGVVRIVRSNPAMFGELYPPRYINNIYFDSLFLKSFYETLDGVSNRAKYRLRWYGDIQPEIPVESQLEIKVREGLLNTKKTFQLEKTDFSTLNTENIKEHILESTALPHGFREELISKIPLLINSYKRNYYISADGKFRLTVDRNIQYLSGKSPDLIIDSELFNKEQIIVEIKYAVGDDDTASGISSHFPFRLSRNSKYTNGVNILMSHCLI
jgi:SPX domain protein involved in polyphosphate accumulation